MQNSVDRLNQADHDRMDAHSTGALALSSEAWSKNALTGTPATKDTEDPRDEAGRARALQRFNFMPTVELDTGNFNGNTLCHAVRDQMESVHRRLQDPGKRLSFQKQWTATCDSDRALATESGADRVVQSMISSMHERFDHYFDREGYKSLKNALSGTDIGIGIEAQIRGAGQQRNPQPYETFISKESPLEIRDILPGSPAEKSGLQVGDRIMAVNGKSTEGQKRRDVLGATDGNEGQEVKLTVSRRQADGSYRTEEISMVEARLRVDAAEYRNIGDGVGYVRLRNFIADDAGDKMFWALGKTNGDKAIVIDLRNNGGGKVSNMEQIAEQILSEGTLYTEEVRDGDNLKSETRTLIGNDLKFTSTTAGRPEESTTLLSPRRSPRIIPEDKPIVVLVDEYSASASELLAGALRENKRAVIVGVPTTGKSEGQELISLPFDRGAALTDFEFYPGGRAVPHSGIKPDIIAEKSEDPREDAQLASAKAAALDLTRVKHAN